MLPQGIVYQHIAVKNLPNGCAIIWREQAAIFVPGDCWVGSPSGPGKLTLIPSKLIEPSSFLNVTSRHCYQHNCQKTHTMVVRPSAVSWRGHLCTTYSSKKGTPSNLIEPSQFLNITSRHCYQHNCQKTIPNGCTIIWREQSAIFVPPNHRGGVTLRLAAQLIHSS